MKISYPKSITVQMDDPSGLYFDVELKETADGWMFEGWLYHPDYSLKTHIVSVMAEDSKNDDHMDWLPIIRMMNDYIKKNNLTTYYWQQIELAERILEEETE